jgi:hypothetical protein
MEELAHAKDAKVGKDEVFLVHGRNSDRWGRTFRGVGGRGGNFEIRNAEIGIGPTTLLTRFAEELRRAPGTGGEGRGNCEIRNAEIGI